MEIEYRRFSTSDGVGLAFADLGVGETALLLHGFASDSRTNWVRTGVVGALLDADRRIVLLDARGHGRSEKLHDPAYYGRASMVRDVRELLDLLSLAPVDVVGYSMGALVAIELALKEPRVRSLVLGGLGLGQATTVHRDQAQAVVEALETQDKTAVTDARALAFRNFADATGADTLALAASQRATSDPFSMDELGAISLPTLVVNGEKDTMVGAPDSLAKAIPGALFVSVPGDHISAVAKPEFSRSVVDFLGGPTK